VGGDFFHHYLLDCYGGNTKQKPIKGRDTVVQKYLIALLNSGPTSLADLYRELVLPANLGMLII
jgi:hypothetical protein